MSELSLGRPVSVSPDEVPKKLLVDLSTGESSMVPLNADELAQRQVDQAAAAAVSVVEAKASADRDVLVAKLKAGKATPDEVQQALAEVLR